MMHQRLLVLSILLAAPLAGCGNTEDPAQATAIAAPAETYTYEIRGMHCEGCVDAINMKVNKVADVSSCTIDLETARAVVVVSPDQEQTVHDAIVGLGYEVTPLTDETPAS